MIEASVLREPIPVGPEGLDVRDRPVSFHDMLGVSVRTIAVIGAGTMGAGIAQLAARHDCVVHLIDVNGDVLSRAVAGVTKRLASSVEKGRLTSDERDLALARILPSGKIAGLGEVELAIEAVVENLSVKHKVFAALEAATPSSAVLATNTSSLSVAKIAEGVTNRSRVIGMHFFNPAPVMPLVEVIAGAQSAPSAVDFGYEAALRLGKTPVRAKDTPGFIVNRVARGFYLEALRLLGEGVAGVDEIDAVMRTHGRFKMGPFELMDLIGVDVNLAVSESVWEQMDRHPRFTPHEIQRAMVSQGHLGRKSGRGFYLHGSAAPLPAYAVNRRSFDLSPLLKDVMLAFSAYAGAADAGSTEMYVFCRILGAIINEAGLAFSDGVAGSDDIDTAMIQGTNYPKGPLAWADEIGPRTVRGLLKSLNEAAGDNRYAPAKLFVDAM